MLERHPDVWVMCDDMYEHLVYDGFDRRSLAAVAPGIADRILTVSGVSKTYAMTGFRVGFGAGPKELIAAMVTMQGHATSGVSSVGQAAAAAALDGPQDLVAERSETYRRRRNLVVDALNGCRASPAIDRKARFTSSQASPVASDGAARPGGRSIPTTISRPRCSRRRMLRPWPAARSAWRLISA